MRYRADGGVNSEVNGAPGKDIYFMGIIDILQVSIRGPSIVILGTGSSSLALCFWEYISWEKSGKPRKTDYFLSL